MLAALLLLTAILGAIILATSSMERDTLEKVIYTPTNLKGQPEKQYSFLREMGITATIFLWLVLFFTTVSRAVMYRRYENKAALDNSKTIEVSSPSTVPMSAFPAKEDFLLEVAPIESEEDRAERLASSLAASTAEYGPPPESLVRIFADGTQDKKDPNSSEILPIVTTTFYPNDVRACKVFRQQPSTSSMLASGKDTEAYRQELHRVVPSIRLESAGEFASKAADRRKTASGADISAVFKDNKKKVRVFRRRLLISVEEEEIIKPPTTNVTFGQTPTSRVSTATAPLTSSPKEVSSSTPASSVPKNANAGFIDPELLPYLV